MTPHQSTWSRLRLEFIQSMQERAKDGLNGDFKVTQYIPLSSQRQYWTEIRIQDLCNSCGVSAEIPIIREGYVQVLSILISISTDERPMIHYINIFISNGQDDAGLPWPSGNRHPIFDGTDRPMLLKFMDEQWKFCPVTMYSTGSHRMSNRRLDRRQVLPVNKDDSFVTHKQPREAELIKMDIHSEATSTSQHTHQGVSIPILPLIATCYNNVLTAHDVAAANRYSHFQNLS